MIQINPLKSYIDGGVRAAITTPPSASLVFDLPGKAIWVKGVKLKGTDHTYTFSHDNYITLANTPDSNESEDIKIGVNTSALKSAIDTTYGVVSTTANGLAPKFTSGNKLAATAATTYYFLGWTGTTLKWYQAPFRNIRINSETTDRLGVNSTDPLIISSGNGISVTWDSTNKKIVITNTKPDVNHNTDRTGIKLTTVSGTKKTDSTLILANSATGLNIQGGTNKFLIGDGTNYIEVPITPSFTISNKDATIGTALTTIATIAGVNIKAKIASYSLSNHTHSVKINGSTKTIAASGAVDLGNYLPLSGGTMGGTAWIVWPDSGNWGNNNSGVTFPVIRGGLQWSGQSDYVKLFTEETSNDNLNLVLQFGDDNSNGLSIRNKANTQTSYISSSGVITTGTFKGNLDWSYITNKPSSYTPSAHTHAWNSLTHSSTTENQAILTNGKANGWKLYTLNISGWNNAANNAHSHSNKSVLDGITSTLVSNWNTAYTFVNTITGTDTDKVINKWDEIVNFLAGITEDNKLNTLLNSKLSILLLSAKEILTTKTNNALFWVNTKGTASSITTGPFTDHPYALLSVTNYNLNAENNKFFYRSRLAFSSAGDIKVASCHHENEYKLDETWYNVLTSKNSGISGSTIKLNGTSITVYSSSTADGRFVKKTGDTMSGVLTIDTTGFGALTIKRNDDTNGASIQFRGKSSVYGYIGLNNSTKDKQFLRWNSDTSKTYTILDTSSTYTSNGKGVINGTTITQVDNATNSTNSTNAINARKLVNWYSTRPTSLNTQFGDGSLRIFYATSSTTEGKPAEDSHILHLAWDNTGGWDAQLAVHTRSGKISTRAQNSGTWQPWKTLALTTDIPLSLKNPYSLTTFGVVYDGSAAKVVSPSNFISLVNEAASTVTDGTMLITSYASNSGFADTNAVNVPYKRKAIHLWEYIKAKTDSLYATRGHNHDDRYLKLTGGTMTGSIAFSNSSYLLWNNGSYHLRIFLTDDSTADTAVFTFLQSSDSGVNWSNLMTIRDNGKVIANTFVGALLGNASTATKLTSSAGNAALPIYFSDGKPVACTASLIFSNLSNSGNNISVTVAGQNRTLTVGYANNSNTVDGYHEYSFAHSWRSIGDLYTKFITITRGNEKGFICLHCAVEDNSGIKGADYIVNWSYDATNENKSITIKCLSSYGSNADTSVYAVRKSGTLFDLLFKSLSTGAFYVGFSVISYSSSCTIDNYNIVGYTEKTKPQIEYTSSAMLLITDITGNSTSATKLTSSAGSTTLPIYFSDGKPIACNASSIFSNLSNNGNNLSITVAGLNRLLTIAYASTTSKLISRGNLAAYEEGSTTKGESGVNLYTIYNNGYPVKYGNLLHINGSGAGQLLAEWCGSATLGHLYYRSKRDNSDNGWSAWGKVAFVTDNVATASKWITARKITLSGSITGSVSIDGSGDVTLATTTHHTHNWENIEGKPNTFTPSAHTHSYITISTCSTLNENSNNFSVEYAGGSNSVATKPSGVDAFSVMKLRTASGWYGLILMSNSKGIYYRSANGLTSSVNWIKLLDSSNSSVSGGGSTWGSSITVNINGTSKILTIPGNPNTDYRVTQSKTTTANYRPLVLGYTNVSTAGSGMTESVTNQVYLSNKFYVQPSTGNLYATTFVGSLSGNASTATSASKWTTARTLTLTGSITGSASIDGSSNVSLSTTTNHSHSWSSITNKPCTLISYSRNNENIDANNWKVKECSFIEIRNAELTYSNLAMNGYNSFFNFWTPDGIACTQFQIGSNAFYYRSKQSGSAIITTNWYKVMDSNNCSVSKSGETLTVKINGTSQSLTNTWRGILDNLTSSTNTTQSLSAKLGYLLANGSARDNTKLPLSGGTMTGVIKSTFNSNTWINGVTNSVVKGEYTNYGAILSMPVKDGRVSISSYPSNDNYIYFGYATTAYINAGTNNLSKKMYWDAANNKLVADTFLGALLGNATTATTATKLSTSSAGSASLPVYFSNGIPVACTKSSIFSNLSNNGDQLSITVAGYNRLLTVAYASRADSAIDADYASSADWAEDSLHASSADSATNADYATNADTLDGHHAYEFALSGHTHTLKLESSTKNSSMNLVHGGKYELTAGGNSIIFTLPANNNTAHTTFTWTNGSTAGPTGSLSGNHTAVSFPAIPSATASISGIVTTGTLTFAGNKTFNGNITLEGGYLIKRVGCSVSWSNGRNSAIVRLTTASGYSTVVSSKTTNGSWEMGNYTSNGDSLYFTYISDSNYNSGNNAFSGQIYFNSTGSIYANHFYESSDIRYKRILRNLSINSNTIANLPLFDFEWIENNAIGTGTSALAVLLILPNLVFGTDKLTLDYGVLGTIAGITACKELVTLKSELLQLKEKVKLLEDKLSKYENTL